MAKRSKQGTPVGADPAGLRKAYRTTVTIGLAMMASLLVYAVVVEVIKNRNPTFRGFSPLSADTFTTLLYTLLTFAIVEFFVIRIVNKALLSAKNRAVQSAPAAAPYAQLMSAAIVTFVLCETVAICGLVLFLIQGDTTDFYLFLMISLVYFTIYFPKYNKWEEWVRGKDTATRRR
jgi:F0F1-type ATP synthase membrane subunit c/vacuolar-type H+-ATPase subunit K